MDLNALQARIEKWENLHTEFMEVAAHEDDLSAGMVAFANTDSGQLMIGVSNTKQIVGITDPDKVMQRLDQISLHNIEPPLTIVQETIRTENGVIIVVNVPKGDQRPYRTNRGDYFIRTTTGRRQASRQELLRLFQSIETLYDDKILVLRAALSDIDAAAFENYIRQAYQRPLEEFGIRYEDLLKNLGYIRQQDDRFFPTLACLLFFGREPQRLFPHAHIVAARIPGMDLAAPPSDNKRIIGTLPVQLEDAARFLQIHLPIAHRSQGFAPEVYPELPQAALREILVNALVHRDYTVLAPVRIFIFDNRVEIRTPGELPNTVTIEAIRLGAAHVLRNPTIYMLFSRLGLVTGIGTGIYRAIHQIREFTHAEPAFFIAGNEFVVSIPRPQANQ